MQQKDAFGLVLFDETIRAVLPPKSSGTHFRNMGQIISEMTGGGKTDITNALLTIAPQCKQRGIVVVVSDFVDETDQFGEGLGQMSFLGQDVILSGFLALRQARRRR